MPWTTDDQHRAEERNKVFLDEFNQRMETWRNTVTAGQQDQSQAAVENTLNLWRANMQENPLQSFHESFVVESCISEIHPTVSADFQHRVRRIGVGWSRLFY